MDEVSVLQLLGQVSGTEAGEVFREFLRGSVRQMICEVMAAEVTGVDLAEPVAEATRSLLGLREELAGIEEILAISDRTCFEDGLDWCAASRFSMPLSRKMSTFTEKG